MVQINWSKKLVWVKRFGLLVLTLKVVQNGKMYKMGKTLTSENSITGAMNCFYSCSELSFKSRLRTSTLVTGRIN